MNRCNCAIFYIDQQYRDTIGGLDRYDAAGRIGNKRIALPQTAGPAIGGHNDIGMDLFECRQ